MTAPMSTVSDSHRTTESRPTRVAVIGGGLAGLSAAHRLTELSKDRAIAITVFEASSRLGGLVGTERIGNYLVDVGADSFLTIKPGAVNLCRRLGIEHRLVRTDARYRGAMVLYEGRPVPVPEGFQLLSPTAIWPIITTPILSVWGKCRLLMEWYVERRSNFSSSNSPVPNAKTDLSALDESVAEFTRRRFGREALDRLIQPLVGGIYTSDPEKLSLAATMPRFLEMEQEYGSLIRAALHQKRDKQRKTGAATANSGAPDSSSGARYGQFAGLKGGMEDLVGALRQFVQSHCDVRMDTGITQLERHALSDSTSQSQYRLTLENGTSEEFDAVLVATSAEQAARLLQSTSTQLGDEIRQIEHASSALVITGHRLADIRNPMHSFGLVIPHKERRKILAVSFSSRKFPERAPADRILLRTFVGGAMQPEQLDQTDEQMIDTVKSELAEIFGVSGTPDFAKVYRYRNAMPQYHVGHLDRINRIEEIVKSLPGLGLTGIAYRGVGIPDVIANAELSAEMLIKNIVR